MSKGFVTSLFASCLAIAVLWILPKGNTIQASSPAPNVEAEATDLAIETLEDEMDLEPTITEILPVKTEEVKLASGSSVYNTLVRSGISPANVLDLIAAAKPVRDLATIAAKTIISLDWLETEDKHPRRISFKLSDTESLIVEHAKEDERWSANLEKAVITKKLEQFSGVVRSSLWDSAGRAGVDGALINKMAAVFAWQVDFSRGVQPGDRWRIVAERVYADGEPIGWGDIMAAEYENTGVLVTAIRYVRDGVKGEYFQPDGNSLKRMFLKSPLNFGRITSHFNRNRFHPILKKHRPHLGVDYGAPRGTPVMAVGNGVVEYIGRQGASGNTVKIRHNSSYQTAYKHLHKYGKGLKPGTTVAMGDVIGYVGSTGLATGPHLHFEMYENGRYVDPLGIKFPSADPVPKEFQDEFKMASQRSLSLLPDWAEAEVIESTLRIAKNDPSLQTISAKGEDVLPEEASETQEEEPVQIPLDPTSTMH